MLSERVTPEISEFMRYLATHPEAEDGLPPLDDLSRELGISRGALREQLEVARALGLVDIKPRTGTRRRSVLIRAGRASELSPMRWRSATATSRSSPSFAITWKSAIGTRRRAV